MRQAYKARRSPQGVHFDAGWSSPVARRAHNPKVIGSNPIPAIHKADASHLPFFVVYWLANVSPMAQSRSNFWHLSAILPARAAFPEPYAAAMALARLNLGPSS